MPQLSYKPLFLVDIWVINWSCEVDQDKFFFHLCQCFLQFIGWILIDRCGKHFGIILNFLRDGSAPLPESPRETAELLAEAKYYCVAELGINQWFF